MTEPQDFPRRVLAMAVGLTPQVVTETVYALAVRRDPAWIPTEVWLMTTSEGAMRARLTLLDPQIGQFHNLCRQYGLEDRVRFTEAQIVTLASERGPLEDIRTQQENACAADALTDFVRGLCADPDAAVHVSIAGGRKSMGYYLGYALSLFGRAQDRLSHVLVNEPFESVNDFYFPPCEPRVVFGQGNRPASTADAVVGLAEIPFVRLRDGLPRALLEGRSSFGHTVEVASRGIAPLFLRLRPQGARVRAGGVELALPPLLWAWYAMLAEALRRGEGEHGMLRYTEVAGSRLLAFYALAAGHMSAGWLQLEEQVRSEQGGVAETYFREKNAKLNRALRDALGPQAAPYLVQTTGRRPLTRHGLALPPACLEVPDVCG